MPHTLKPSCDCVVVRSLILVRWDGLALNDCHCGVQHNTHQHSKQVGVNTCTFQCIAHLHPDTTSGSQS